MKCKCILIGLIFLLNIVVTNIVFADNQLRVGVLNIPPYAYEEDGVYQGLAV